MKPKTIKNKNYYNINFVTNDWNAFYKIIIKNLPKGVYVEEIGVWKNRNLLEEYSKTNEPKNN